ncbi:hypothetical protein MMC06_000385 [Schaereria dolodes]|nr:hypothetical protein [Schaereria dolodes]
MYEGKFTDRAIYVYKAPGAGDFQTRTPGEYKTEVPQMEKRQKTNSKPGYYETNEFIHLSVRFRMGLMKMKPQNLGSASGWLWGQNLVKNYEPAAMKGSIPAIPNNGFYNYQWKNPAPKKGEDDVVIKEYQIPPEWSTCEGLERELVPSAVMKELDEANNYGEKGLIKVPPTPSQTGFQPQLF